jgi:RNA polymerase sigma-70 factor (ECF subfamily)
VLIDEQDRARWNHPELEEARAVLERALALDGRGPYVLQAQIAVLHAADRVDWEQLASLYAQLGCLTGSQVVELNRAAATAEAGDVEGALAAVEALDLQGYHYLHATRAELLRRLGRPAEARVAYARALELVHTEPERRFLERRLAEL